MRPKRAVAPDAGPTDCPRARDGAGRWALRVLSHSRLATHDRPRPAEGALGCYTPGVDFVWDEQKNESKIGKHGFDFADAHRIFAAPMLVGLDERDE
jgi:hypothetical protein